MPAQAPLDRLSPRDFYKQLDRLAEHWNEDEYEIAARLKRLRHTFEHLPDRYYDRAMPQLGVIARARIVNGVPWQDAIRELAAIVSDWNLSRPALLQCDECGLLVRGHRRLLNHRQLVHGFEEVA